MRIRVLCLLGLLGCGADCPRAPAVGSVPAEHDACSKQRDRASALLAEGKLHRAKRVLSAANASCPSDAGRTAELDVARELEGAARGAGSVEAGRAAFEAATLLDVKGDLDAAYAGYVRAWDAGADATALVRAGQIALRQGRRADAQRLFDRGLAELERHEGDRAALDLDVSGGDDGIAWSSRGRIAIASGSSVVVVDGRSLRVVTRVRAQAKLGAVAFSPDGRVLVGGTDFGRVYVWDAETGAPITEFDGHGGDVRSITFSADGATIASTSYQDAAPLLRSVATGKPSQTLAAVPNGCAGFSAFAAEGTLAWGCANDVVHLSSTVDGHAISDLPHDGKTVYGIAVSPDGATLATGGEAGVRLWRVADGAPIEVFAVPGEAVVQVAFSWDQKTLFAATKDGAIAALRIADGVELWSIHVGEWPRLALSPDGATLAVQDGRGVSLRSATDGHPVAFRPSQFALIADLYQGAVSAIAFSPENDRLASASWDGTVRLWGLDDASLRTLVGGGGAFETVAFARGAPVLAAGGSADLCFWDPAHLGAARCVEDSRGATALALSPNGATLVVRTTSGLEAFSVAERRKVETPYVGASGLVASADGATLASERDGWITLRHVVDGEAIGAWSSGERRLVALAFSPDGTTLASSSDEYVLKLWSVPKGDPIRTITTDGPVRAIAFSADGATVATADRAWSGPRVHLYAVSDGRRLRDLEGEDEDVVDLAFSPNGDLLASATPTTLSLRRTTDFALVTALRHFAYIDAGLVTTPGGLVEVVGGDAELARRALVCRVGSVTLDFEVCSERLEVPRLLSRVLGGDATWAEP